MQVKLTEIEKIKILNSEDIYLVMQRVLMRENKIERNKEHFWIIGLANNNRILYIELISLGTVNSAPVQPMEVFSIALQKRTVKIVLVHNHPAGSLKPSDEDKDITDRLIQVGLFLNIPVIDHLIITEKTYYSFNDSNLLYELSLSKKYVLPYKEQERLLKEREELGAQKRNIHIAQQLKNKGFTISQIAELTSITEEEAKKLKAQKPKSTKK
jgi:DNA repair protein RadC